MLRKTVIARALTIAFGSAIVAAGVVQPAMAQSNATGTIFGVVAPGPDIKVHIENPDTGIRRTLVPDASGRFQATSLPTGNYKVTLLKGDAIIGTADADAKLGAGTEVVFPAQSVQTVQVSGQRRSIDVSTTTGGATFTAKQLDALPIARNIDGIIQLAPNTTKVDSRFAGGASFGGGAASENSYYINGFPVVNPLTGLGASQLPFGAIAEAQVLTGSFGAEFGRSTGGVVNVITKSGTNTWEAGASTSYQPKNLRSDYKDFYYANTGKNPKTDGKIRLSRSHNEYEEQITSLYVGGPIIRDKLFIFAAAEEGDRDQSYVNGSSVSTSLGQNGWRDMQTRTQRYLLKLDYNISDNHRLEFSAWGDTPKQMIQDSGLVIQPGTASPYPDYPNAVRNNVVTSRSALTNIDNNGGKTGMLKYTGNLTQDLTLTGLYGKTVSKHINEFPNYDPTAILFSTVATPTNQAPGVSYPNPQPQTGNVLAPGSKDEVKSYRLDLEWQLGKHTLRGGLDKNKVSSINAGEFKAGGGTYEYLKADPTQSFDVTGAVIPALNTVGGGALANQGYYVRKGLFTDVTNSFGEQEAQYLEDKFQISQNVLITGGLRRESFKNINDAGVTFLNMKSSYSPRLAVAWDANGDASLKIFGTAGRYSVPIPTHIAVRGAGRSTFTDQYFTYTGVNADGSPIISKQLTVPLSGNNEYGQDKDVKTLAALDMKPSYQDEITLGFEKAYSPTLNFGAKVTYRKLKSTIDDFCDVRPFEKYAAAHNIAITNPLWGNTCQTFNPGRDNTFYIDFVGGGKNDTLVHLTKAEQGFPDPERTYAALDLFAEHPLRNGWYGKVNYTLSRNKGNTEGQVRSDNGQTDVSATSVWDYPELMAGANGLLPNDRKHQLKAYGFYQLNKQLTFGANGLVASGRPRSCIGSAPNPGDSPNYSNQTFYCFGDTRASNVLVQRGTLGRLPWDINLDLNAVYSPEAIKGLAFKIDVFNVFNRQKVTSVTEAYNSGTAVSSTYEVPLSMTSPRSARFTVTYDRKFN
jgi:hypothetical protein